jgi:hypothetical protein
MNVAKLHTKEIYACFSRDSLVFGEIAQLELRRKLPASSGSVIELEVCLLISSCS